jgi:hypothetical protein
MGEDPITKVTITSIQDHHLSQDKPCDESAHLAPPLTRAFSRTVIMALRTRCFGGSPAIGRLVAGPIRHCRAIRETRPVKGVWPIDLCITCPVTTLLAMLTGHLICAVKAS